MVIAIAANIIKPDNDLVKLDQPQPRPWRDALPIHPAAEMFPLMECAELRELADDIDRNGLLEPVDVYDDPEIGMCLLDGRNRLDALELLGRIGSNGNLSPDTFRWLADHVQGSVDPIVYVIGKNIRRRHLNRDQKRELITKLLVMTPDRSNREIAGALGCDPKTVASVRDEAEATGEIPRFEKTKGKDGRYRPAQKSAAKRSPEAPISASTSTSSSTTQCTSDHSTTNSPSTALDALSIDLGTMPVLWREVQSRAVTGDKLRLAESLKRLLKAGRNTLAAIRP